MKTPSASSRSAARATVNPRSTSPREHSDAKSITAEEFDRLANLPADDPEGDLEPYMDHDKSLHPGRAVQRVNVDFPTPMLRAIDREATRLGVTRQAFIKIRLADTLPKSAGVTAPPRRRRAAPKRRRRAA